MKEDHLVVFAHIAYHRFVPFVSTRELVQLFDVIFFVVVVLRVTQENEPMEMVSDLFQGREVEVALSRNELDCRWTNVGFVLWIQWHSVEHRHLCDRL